MDPSINGVKALAVEALLAAGLSDSVSDLTRLDHGRSGAETYLLEAGVSHYVLRIQTFADKDAEAVRFVAAQKAASDVGVAPRLLASTENGRAVLSERVIDVSFLGAVHGPAGMAVLANLGEKLATLHTLSPPDIGKAKPPAVFIAAMMEKAAARWPLPSFMREAQADFEKRDIDFPATDFCHLDLNPSNILFDGDSVWLVDWQTAGMSSGWLDLATVSEILLLAPEQFTGFIDAYVARRQVPFPSSRILRDSRLAALLSYASTFVELCRQPFVAEHGNQTLSLPVCYSMISEQRLDISTDAGRWALATALINRYWEVSAQL